ncbi:MAG: hypothetical protein CMC71_00595, partial [Flavobacteriaceae bacterium]|nr:hypothetical protein [Flavobacteriaceae bacterium]
TCDNSVYKLLTHHQGNILIWVYGNLGNKLTFFWAYLNFKQKYKYFKFNGKKKENNCNTLCNTYNIIK